MSRSSPVGSKFKTILLRNIRSLAVPAILDILVSDIMETFDSELVGKAPLEDPTAPENFRVEFEEMLYNSIKESLVVSDTTVSFSIGDKDKLGYNGISDPMSTMVFILEGILGEYAYIPKRVIKARFKDKASYGRYGKGFLVSKDSFFKKGWSNFISWDEARWAFSNTKPIDVFRIDESKVVAILTSTVKTSIHELAVR